MTAPTFREPTPCTSTPSIRPTTASPRSRNSCAWMCRPSHRGPGVCWRPVSTARRNRRRTEETGRRGKGSRRPERSKTARGHGAERSIPPHHSTEASNGGQEILAGREEAAPVLLRRRKMHREEGLPSQGETAPGQTARRRDGH